MKKRVTFPVLILCVAMAVAVMVSSSQAQDVKNKRIGTASATELLIPVGARDLAMSGSSLATSIGVEAIHWNPAGLGRLQTAAEALVSSMSYIGDIRVNYGAVGVAFGGFGVIGFSVKSLDFGDVPLTTVDDPEGRGGRTFSPTFVTVGLTYSRAFTDAITAGGTVKIISEKMAQVTGSGFALDLGVQYHSVAGIKGLDLGVAMKNVGPQVSFDGTGLLRRATSPEGRRPEQFYKSEAASFELPSSVEIGLAVEREFSENMKYTITSAFVNNNLGLDSYRFGGEIGYSMERVRLYGRGGIDLSPKGKDDAQIFGPTVGFGLYYAAPGIDIMIDYAYRSVDFFDNNSVFSLKFGF